MISIGAIANFGFDAERTAEPQHHQQPQQLAQQQKKRVIQYIDVIHSDQATLLGVLDNISKLFLISVCNSERTHLEIKLPSEETNLIVQFNIVSLQPLLVTLVSKSMYAFTIDLSKYYLNHKFPYSDVKQQRLSLFELANTYKVSGVLELRDTMSCIVNHIQLTARLSKTATATTYPNMKATKFAGDSKNNNTKTVVKTIYTEFSSLTFDHTITYNTFADNFKRSSACILVTFYTDRNVELFNAVDSNISYNSFSLCNNDSTNANTTTHKINSSSRFLSEYSDFAYNLTPSNTTANLQFIVDASTYYSASLAIDRFFIDVVPLTRSCNNNSSTASVAATAAVHTSSIDCRISRSGIDTTRSSNTNAVTAMNVHAAVSDESSDEGENVWKDCDDTSSSSTDANNKTCANNTLSANINCNNKSTFSVGANVRSVSRVSTNSNKPKPTEGTTSTAAEKKRGVISSSMAIDKSIAAQLQNAVKLSLSNLAYFGTYGDCRRDHIEVLPMNFISCKWRCIVDDGVYAADLFVENSATTTTDHPKNKHTSKQPIRINQPTY